MPFARYRHAAELVASGIANASVTTGTTSNVFTFGWPHFNFEILSTPDGTTDDLVVEVYASSDGTNFDRHPIATMTLQNSTAAATRWTFGVSQEQCGFAKAIKLTLKRSGSTDTFGTTYLYARPVVESDQE